jgi:hypothetical protein
MFMWQLGQCVQADKVPGQPGVRHAAHELEKSRSERKVSGRPAEKWLLTKIQVCPSGR